MTFKLLLWSFLALTISLLSCNSKSDSIVLQIIFPKSKTEKLLGKYVYIVDVAKRTTIDSALVKGDTVVFNKKWDSTFVPYMVTVNKLDTLSGHPYLRLLGFTSPYAAKSIYSLFYLDKGVTTIKPYFNDDSTIKSGIIGSKQNEPYLKNIELHYPRNDSVNRQAIIDKNILIIREYPYSVHLLTQLFKYKEKFLDTDLRKLMSYFDNSVQKTSMFKSFANYFASSSTFDKAFPTSITLEDNKGKYQKIGNDSADYNLIVYWASWCGPCRKEIPELKALYGKFADKGLAITSISIDEVKLNWQTALKQEKMPWQQLIAIDSTRTVIDLHYSIEAIPKMYLFNSKKQLIGTSENDYVTPKFISALFDNKLRTSYR